MQTNWRSCHPVTLGHLASTALDRPKDAEPGHWTQRLFEYVELMAAVGTRREESQKRCKHDDYRNVRQELLMPVGDGI